MTADRSRRVAVLGAGIMGCSVALELARRGCQVVLVDAAGLPFTGASRWNEGKLHLGYLYAGDQTLSTAQHLLPGGVSFVDMASELVGRDLAPAVTQDDDIFLVHRNSVVDVDQTRARFLALSSLLRSYPGAHRYPGNAARGSLHELTRSELERCADTRFILAGFRVPERSISTRWVADRYIEALSAQPGIALAMATHVAGVIPLQAAGREQWQVDCDPSLEGRFDAVVNALWAGRLAVDDSLGLQARPGWSHRYRLSLFLRTRIPVSSDCIVISTGPFGDIKNYNDRDFYLSWYPAGLQAQGEALLPPTLPALGDAALKAIVDSTVEGLSGLIPGVKSIIDQAQSIQVQGGWVFAQGKGALDDAASTLHKRESFGISQRGSYFSVDTGKYSVAPWLARRVADRITGVQPRRAKPQ